MAQTSKEEKEAICVGYFEVTGCLITMIGSAEHDKKIRPKGI